MIDNEEKLCKDVQNNIEIDWNEKNKDSNESNFDDNDSMRDFIVEEV